jgi:hypothetical protein
VQGHNARIHTLKLAAKVRPGQMQVQVPVRVLICETPQPDQVFIHLQMTGSARAPCIPLKLVMLQRRLIPGGCEGMAHCFIQPPVHTTSKRGCRGWA